MNGKIVYLTRGDIDLENAITAIRGREHWIVIGEDWWTLSEYAFSDMLEVTCKVQELAELDLMQMVGSVNRTSKELLEELKNIIFEKAIRSQPQMVEPVIR